jgi:hypothetical protein
VHIEDSPPKFDKNSRRADPTNANRILTVGFGHGAEAGTKDQMAEHRSNTFYRSNHHGSKPAELDPNTCYSINKERGNFNLANKFDYGHDAEGGPKAGKQPDDPRQMQDCIK